MAMSTGRSLLLVSLGCLGASGVLDNNLDDDVCDWPKVDGSTLSLAEFERLYLEKQPVLLTNLMKDWQGCNL